MRNYESRHTVSVLRKIIGLSQGELAALAGCSKRTIQAVEIGRLKLSEGLASKIAHETGVDETWLLGGDLHSAPKLMFTGVPYDKRVFEETRAAIESGKNPNPITVNFAHEDPSFFQTPPIPMMTKLFERLNSLLHPQITYWLASILASISAASEVGQGKMAIRRLSNFADTMKKEFGQRLDDESTNDAAAVFEQALQHIKITEFLVKKRAGGHEPSSKSDKPMHKDLLATWQFGSELQGYDLEALYTHLNAVGERLKARSLSYQKFSETLDEQMTAVFRTPKAGGFKPPSSSASSTAKSEMPVPKKTSKNPNKD